jgi:hypothetical protein
VSKGLSFGVLSLGVKLSGVVLAAGALVLGHSMSQPVVAEGGDEGGVAAGPDVIVGAIPDIGKYGASGGIAAYSFGSTSCNIGTVQLEWIQNTNQHPVIPQNMYRLKDGRFEQIGMSWVKHGFCALQQNLCGTCTPAGPGCPNMLGVGCSDPYSASLNGTQSGLGPRSQVNASTGFFPFPYTPPAGISNLLSRRIQVALDDLNPSLNSGAQYFAEAQYIHPDDAAADNDNNNASYRKFTVGSLVAGSYNLTLTGPTAQQKPAIFAWKDSDATVTINSVDVPNDGRFFVGYKVKANGNGTWNYEFAIFNLNSDRSGASFSVPIPDGVNVTNIGFKDIAHHSGEPFNSIDWSASVANGALTWSVTETFQQNPNANALRWSTLYNFRFDADQPPSTVLGTLGVFKPAPGGDSFTVSVAGPTAPALPCPADFNNDNVVNGTDLGYLLGSWGTVDADANGDGITDAADLAILLGGWGNCP